MDTCIPPAEQRLSLLAFKTLHQLGIHTRALQRLPHMLVLFEYTYKSERIGLEYTAVPFPTEGWQNKESSLGLHNHLVTG